MRCQRSSTTVIGIVVLEVVALLVEWLGAAARLAPAAGRGSLKEEYSTLSVEHKGFLKTELAQARCSQ